MQEFVILSVYFLLANDKEEEHKVASMVLFSDDHELLSKGTVYLCLASAQRYIWFCCWEELQKSYWGY